MADLSQKSPQNIYQEIEKYGYIGQEGAKKSLSLMAFRHINRLKKIYLDNIDVFDLPKKDNYMLIGPTGCGKTFLVEILFQKILQLPTVIIDITSYSETGYVGQDPVAILTRLIYAAEKDPDIASIGIVCLDEFDKLSSGKNNAVFSGAGTTKDVSGIGVQRELLKMLEGAEVDVPVELSHSSYSPRMTFDTSDVAFIACGAFSGFKSLTQSGERMGFGKNTKDMETTDNKIAVSYNREDVAKTAHFEKYGMMPELIGRFSRIIPFHALSKDDLKNILQKNTIHQYEKELSLEGIKLEIEDAVLDQIVQDAVKRETGARAINYALLDYIEDACFEIYSSRKKIKRLRIFKKGKTVEWALS